MLTGVSKAVREAVDTKEHVSKAVDPHDKSIAAHAVDRNVGKDNKALVKALKNLYADAGMKGTREALTQMGGAAKVGSSMSGLVAGVDWANWKPGAPKVAEEAMGDALAKVNTKTMNIADGIIKTTLDRMKDVIANGLTNGLAYNEIGQSVDELINDPRRADIIAITETNRAFNASAIDEYQTAEMPGWEWIAYAGACEECESEEGPHDFGDEYPPAHPSCRCAVVTQLPDGTTTEISEEE